ncbi:MAG TPA: hypothetical protein VLH83_03455 [Chthoniobacterales bacterium]|nr:hypothetical protein [Chthoniobacterales bacterium]
MSQQTYNRPPRDVSPEEVSQTLDKQLTSLDPQRAQAFSGLKTVRDARHAGYLREKERLTLKYGDDHPRVTAMEDKVRSNEGLRRDLEFEAARAKIEAPVVDQNSYVFHGFVRNCAGEGMARLTIALYDEEGNWLRIMGYACTDERGYFLMRYQTGRNGHGADPNSTSGLFSAAPADPATGSASKPSARIHVLDSKPSTLQIEKELLYPQLGQVDFRIIIICAEAVSCAPPPSNALSPSTTEVSAKSMSSKTQTPKKASKAKKK